MGPWATTVRGRHHSNVDFGNHSPRDHYHMTAKTLQSATEHEVIADYSGESIDQLDKPPHSYLLASLQNTHIY